MMTWRDEIARHWPDYAEGIRRWPVRELPPSGPARITDVSPSTWWTTKETECFLEFQKDLRLSLLREIDEDQDPTDRTPEAGEV